MIIKKIISPEKAAQNLASESIIKVATVKPDNGKNGKDVRVDIWCEKDTNSIIKFLPVAIFNNEEEGASFESSYPDYNSAVDDAVKTINRTLMPKRSRRKN